MRSILHEPARGQCGLGMVQVSGHVWRGQHLPSALDVLVPQTTANDDGSGRTLLIGWELGAGRGHVERLVPVIRLYLERGWKVVAVLRDVPLGNACFAGLRDRYGPGRLHVAQAPRFRNRRFPDQPLVSLPQIYCYMGFDDLEMVAPLVRQWEVLLRHFRPDAVLSDASPALNLAVRGRLPLSVIGNGWTLPPDCDAMPLLKPVPEGVAFPDFEANVVACASAAVGRVRAPERFCDLLRGDRNALCVIPELDPYREHRTDRYYWSPEMPAPASVDPAERRGGLVYLPADHPARASVTEACAKSNIAFKGYFGGAGAGRFGNLTVYDRPIDFIREVPRSKVVIHHGGLGTAMWAMVNHVSQWPCARDTEKSLTAHAVVNAEKREFP